MLVPNATFPYIPIEPRLRLWFSEPSMVQLMTEYRRFVEREAPNIDDTSSESSSDSSSDSPQPRSGGRYIDFFSGSYFQKTLKPTGKFDDVHQRDLALLVSLDEFGPFKKRPWFKVAPILITCFNIPPEIRFKDRFLLSVGFIPGQTEPDRASRPKDRGSFLRPLVDEMKALGSNAGVRAYDALADEDFDMRAHLCVAILDMGERYDVDPFVYHMAGESGYFCIFWYRSLMSKATIH